MNKIQTLRQLIPGQKNVYHKRGFHSVWIGDTTIFLEYSVGTLVTVLALIDRRDSSIIFTSHAPKKDEEREELIEKFISAFSS